MIRNTLNGFHFNSKYWQDYKKQLAPINGPLWDIALGMSLGDASIYKTGKEAYIKFEQGHKQKEFLYLLFDLFKNYCFMEKPGIRYELRGDRAGKIKSYWFKTFSHRGFTPLRSQLYVEGRKSIQEEFLFQHLNSRALAYLVMSDGSLHREGKTFILHTQSFTHSENESLARVLASKFSLKCKCIDHKKKYSVIEISGSSAPQLYELLVPHLIPSMLYKLPRQ